MRIRDAIPLSTTFLVLIAAGCGDGGEDAPAPGTDTSTVTADDVAPAEAPADTRRAPATESSPAGAGGPEAAPRDRTVFTVQVGAFVQTANARDLRRRLEEADLPVWDPRAEVAGRTFERIRVGATPTVVQSRRLAERVRDALEVDSWIAPVPPEEELPPGVLDSTRQLLDGA